METRIVAALIFIYMFHSLRSVTTYPNFNCNNVKVTLPILVITRLYLFMVKFKTNQYGIVYEHYVTSTRLCGLHITFPSSENTKRLRVPPSCSNIICIALGCPIFSGTKATVMSSIRREAFGSLACGKKQTCKFNM